MAAHLTGRRGAGIHNSHDRYIAARSKYLPDDEDSAEPEDWVVLLPDESAESDEDQ